MASDERFDIFDEHRVKTGTAARYEVHAKGLWHQTFHCWVLRREAGGEWQILLQLRHQDKDTHPGKLDISCAGHLLAGEEPADGVRELAEELGLCASVEDLELVGIIPENDTLENCWIDREFCHVFLYECLKPLEDYCLQVSEVAGLYQVAAGAFMELVGGVRPVIIAEGIVYEEETGRYMPSIREVCRDDLSPNSAAYYDTLFTAIRDKIHRHR